MAVLQSTSITGGLVMHGMSVGFMRLNAQGAVVIDTSSYPTTTGSGASGTWGINVTGTAASETLATVTARGATTSTALTLSGNVTLGGQLTRSQIGFENQNGFHRIALWDLRFWDWDIGADIFSIGQGDGNVRVTNSLFITSNTASGRGNLSFNTSSTVIGNIHIQNGAGPGDSNSNQAAITFMGSDSSQAQAGIYVLNNNSYGTSMGFATTNSYAAGPQIYMTASNGGVVNFTRANPTVQGNGIWHAGNLNPGSYLALSGGTMSGALIAAANPGGDHGLRVGAVRGQAVGSQGGDYIMLYERVHIGHPNGWGAPLASAPSFGLGTWGSIHVSQSNATGGGIILADDGDIVDLNDAWCSMRFTSGVRIYSANRGGSPVISLGSNGVIAAGNITTGINANHIVQRDASGYIYANHINFNTSESENPPISSFITSNGDGWSRKSSIQHVRNQLGNYGGWITGETDTLNSVTSRGNTIDTRSIRFTNASSHGIRWDFSSWTNNAFVRMDNTFDLTLGGHTSIRFITNHLNAGDVVRMSIDMGGTVSVAGTLTAGGDLRAPIFYDSADTGYYLDPNSNSNLWKFTADTMARNDMNPLSVNSPWSTRSGQSSHYRNGTMGWGQVDLNTVGSYWGSGFIDSWSNPGNAPGGSSHYVGMQGMHYNDQNGNFHGWQMVCAQESTNRWFWRSSWNVPNRPWVEMIHSGNIGSQSVNYANSAGSAGSSGVSSLVDVPDWRNQNLGPSSFAGHRVGFHFNNTSTLGGNSDFWMAVQTVNPWCCYDPSHRQQQLLWGGSGGLSFRFATGTTTWSSWSRIYSDSYRPYADSAGNANTVGGYSVAVGGSANTIPTRNSSGYLIPENWIQLNGHYGLYSPTNNMHLYPNNLSYGSVRIIGERNGWRGIHFGDGTGITLMMNEGEFGFHREAVGWVARFTSGTGHFNISGNASTATDVYNLNFTLGNTHYWTGIQYFQTNNGGYVGSTDSARLQAFATGGNAAFMSFHRSGNYAVNFGLDADNVLRIGGWSAAANRWQLDMSGNMTVAGDVCAYSDARVKENIITVENALDKVTKMRGVFYNRTDSDDKSRKVGVIAQEMLEVVPEVVNQDKDGMYNVSYGNIAGVLIEAIKEQQAIIEDLKRQIEYLVENK